MKHRYSKQERKEQLRALTNPHLLISLGIAWFITNGWAYCAVGIGWYLDIPLLLKTGSVWLGILWMPCTPEKIFTVAIAIGILRLLFPEDTRTLAAVRRRSSRFLALIRRKAGHRRKE